MGKSTIHMAAVVPDKEFMEPTLRAMRKSLSIFDKIDLVSIICPQNARVAHEFGNQTAEFTYDTYSEFMVKELVNYTQGDYLLTIQWDSCIIDNKKWTNDFLKFSYIGACWQNSFINRVGNGGCSLRSRKFLEESAKLNYIKTDNPIANNEDIVSCVINYEKMVAAGVKFAPLMLARQFSVERPIPESPHNYDDISTYKSFAFHGDFNTGGMKFIEE